jgi:hypothetical protein
MSTAVLFDSAHIAHAPHFAEPIMPFIRQVDHQRCYDLGHTLGLQDRDAALPPDDWSEAEKDSFLDGLSWGNLQCHADRAEAYAMDLARQADELEDLQRLESGFVGY